MLLLRCKFTLFRWISQRKGSFAHGEWKHLQRHTRHWCSTTALHTYTLKPCHTTVFGLSEHYSVGWSASITSLRVCPALWCCSFLVLQDCPWTCPISYGPSWGIILFVLMSIKSPFAFLGAFSNFGVSEDITLRIPPEALDYLGVKAVRTVYTMRVSERGYCIVNVK